MAGEERLLSTTYVVARTPTAALPLDFTLAERAQAEKWDACFVALRNFLLLEDDWNGEGARAPLASNVYAALAWLQQSRQDGASPPQAVPGVMGEVLLVWQAPSFYFEVEINDGSQAEYMFVTHGQSAMHWTAPLVARTFVPTTASWSPRRTEKERVVTGATLPTYAA
jgi:hypothetical protein